MRPGNIRIGGGWTVNPRTGLPERDPTHGMRTPVRHRDCGHVYDLVRAGDDCPGCNRPADWGRLERL